MSQVIADPAAVLAVLQPLSGSRCLLTSAEPGTYLHLAGTLAVTGEQLGLQVRSRLAATSLPLLWAQAAAGHGVFTFTTTVQAVREQQVLLDWPQQVVHLQRRRHTRLPFLAPLVVHSALLPEAVVDAQSQDISISGCGFACRLPLICGSGITIQVLRPEFASLGRIDAVVRRCEERGEWFWIGVEFIHPTPALQELIQEIELAATVPYGT